MQAHRISNQINSWKLLTLKWVILPWFKFEDTDTKLFWTYQPLFMRFVKFSLNVSWLFNVNIKFFSKFYFLNASESLLIWLGTDADNWKGIGVFLCWSLGPLPSFDPRKIRPYFTSNHYTLFVCNEPDRTPMQFCESPAKVYLLLTIKEPLLEYILKPESFSNTW